MNLERQVSRREAEANQIGYEAGANYVSIWSSDEERSAALRDECQQKVSQRVNKLGGGSKATLFLLFAVGPIAVGVLSGLATGPIIATWIAILFWVIAFMVVWGSGKSVDRRNRLLAQALTDIATNAAVAVVDGRRNVAQAHKPGKRGKGKKANQITKPEPLPLGVSHKGAEELCAQWMQFFGEIDAKTTRYVADGGIDVESAHYVAQVKNYSGTVGVKEVRELAGVSSADGRKPLFFTSGAYASGAIEFADRTAIALFIYSAEDGSISGSNGLARSLLTTGL